MKIARVFPTRTNMIPTILAYTAGIVDGEGYIGIRKGKPTPRRINFSYDLMVSIAMTNKDIIEWLYYNFGGANCIRNGTEPIYIKKEHGIY